MQAICCTETDEKSITLSNMQYNSIWEEDTMRIKMISSPLPYPYSIRVCVCRVCRVCILYFADDIEQVYAINLHKIQSVQSIRIELYVSLFFLCTFNLRPHFNIEPLNESTFVYWCIVHIAQYTSVQFCYTIGDGRIFQSCLQYKNCFFFSIIFTIHRISATT